MFDEDAVNSLVTYVFTRSKTDTNKLMEPLKSYFTPSAMHFKGMIKLT